MKPQPKGIKRGHIDKSGLPISPPKKSKSGIDTTDLAISKRHPIRNEAYKQSADGKTCMICQACDGTVVGCHISYMHFGRGIKTTDARIAFMCGDCHDSHDNSGDKAHWWMENFILLLLEAQHETWSKSNG